MAFFSGNPGSEYTGSLELEATADEAVHCCIEAALDLGLALKEQGELRLRFREPMRWLYWAVELEVLISPEDGHTGVLALGSSLGGKPDQPVENLERYVKAFLSAVSTELVNHRKSPLGGTRESTTRGRRRAGQKWLTLAERLPFLLFVPMLAAAIPLWPRPGALVFISWCWVLSLVPMTAESIRRRLVGIGTGQDLAFTAVGFGVAVVFVIGCLSFINML